MKPVVHFRDAVALLGRFPALAGADLDVEPGEIVLLRGPNGAGKTTMLRACAGLVPVVRGEAIVLGKDLRRNPRAVRRRVGLLGHATALYDDLTVGENVRFWGRAGRADEADVTAALGVAGLDGRLHDVVAARLSAGQRRRASLACLLARRPELWLLDEPHAGLDAEARDLLDRLVAQAARQGATVLLSSHELDRAEALSDRVVDLVAGTTVGPGQVTTVIPGQAPAGDAPTIGRDGAVPAGTDGAAAAGSADPPGLGPDGLTGHDDGGTGRVVAGLTGEAHGVA